MYESNWAKYTGEPICFLKRISLLYLKANNGKILGYVTTDDGLQINVKGSLLSNEKKQNYEV